MTAGERAGARLVGEKEGLARAITDALYRERPDLQAKYGDAGRAKCLQDMRYNLEHLAPAVALDDPPMFAGYARWLLGLLDQQRERELTVFEAGKNHVAYLSQQRLETWVAGQVGP